MRRISPKIDEREKLHEKGKYASGLREDRSHTLPWTRCSDDQRKGREVTLTPSKRQESLLKGRILCLKGITTVTKHQIRPGGKKVASHAKTRPPIRIAQGEKKTARLEEKSLSLNNLSQNPYEGGDPLTATKRNIPISGHSQSPQEKAVHSTGEENVPVRERGLHLFSGGNEEFRHF